MRQRVGRYLLKPASRTYVAMLFLLICILIGIGTYNNLRLRHDERMSCEIQVTALPGARAQAKINGDMNYLLTIALKQAGPNPGSLKSYSPKQRFNILWVYRDWARATGFYARTQKQQPLTRSCQ